MALVAARTRVHGRDQEEIGGEGDATGRTRDVHHAVLERLPEDVQCSALELGHLVQQEHPMVRKADLPGPGLRAAADERCGRHGVMRRAEGALGAADLLQEGTRPAAEWTAVASSACSNVQGGSRPGNRRASIDLPAPGGPQNSRL